MDSASFPTNKLLEQLAEHQAADLAFRATDAAEAEAHRRHVRPLLAAALGFQDLPAPTSPAMLQASVELPGLERQRWIVPTTPWSATPAYVIHSEKTTETSPIVLAFAGHGYGVSDIVGLWEDGSERRAPAGGYQDDYALHLASMGCLVVAPEIACFGERKSEFANSTPTSAETSTCQQDAPMAAHLGGSLLGLRVLETRRVLDWAKASFGDRRVGTIGISGGGMLSFFTAAIETRVDVCAVSGYFSRWRQSIFALDHCPCNYVHGLARFGEIEDVAALVAPRALLVQAGTRDSIFPIEGVRAAVEAARKAWRFERPEAFDYREFEGRHTLRAEGFFAAFLAALGGDY